MMIDRRTFIQSVALVATTSAAAALVPLTTTALSQTLQIVGPLQAMADDGTDRNPVVLRIDGWDRYDGDIASAPSSVSPVTTVREEVVIKINHSWRAAWR
jgi:hypothetical protein